MKTFIAAIPIFDAEMQVKAYSLSTHNSEKMLGLSVDYLSLGDMMLAVGLDTVESVGVEPFAGYKRLFIEINHYQLLMGAPANKRIDMNRIVCRFPRKMPWDDAILAKCQELKAAGYQLAMELAGDTLARTPVLDLMTYVVADASRVSPEAARNIVRILGREQTLIVEEIPDNEGYRAYSKLPNTWCSGEFYSKPITEGSANISPLKINTLHLIKEANEEDADLARIARTIERDPALSVSLLRFINSPAVGVRRHIDSIRGAVAILGQNELRRWVTVALSMQLGDDRPSEITKLSLIRAKFAENLAPLYQKGVLANSLFMVGLFSLLDVILQKPMEEAVNEVAVDDRVKQALVNQQGDLYEVLELVHVYERANWDKVTINLIRNSVEPEDAIAAFLDALQWYKELLQEIEIE